MSHSQTSHVITTISCGGWKVAVLSQAMKPNYSTGARDAGHAYLPDSTCLRRAPEASIPTQLPLRLRFDAAVSGSPPLPAAVSAVVVLQRFALQVFGEIANLLARAQVAFQQCAQQGLEMHAHRHREHRGRVAPARRDEIVDLVQAFFDRAIVLCWILLCHRRQPEL